MFYYILSVMHEKEKKNVLENAVKLQSSLQLKVI